MSTYSCEIILGFIAEGGERLYMDVLSQHIIDKNRRNFNCHCSVYVVPIRALNSYVIDLVNKEDASILDKIDYNSKIYIYAHGANPDIYEGSYEYIYHKSSIYIPNGNESAKLSSC